MTPLNVRAVLYLRARDGNELLATVTEDDAERFGRGHRPAWARLSPDRFLLFDRVTEPAAAGRRLRRPAWRASSSTSSPRSTSRGKPPVLAVDKVDLAANDGEIVALLGSSGCGKTSTLRMIAGFEDVTSGSIRVGDRLIHALLPKERGVAMAFEGYALYPPLTVRDNIGFALLRERRPRAEIAERVAAVAALLEIATSSTATRPPSRPRQRGAARAPVRRAPVSLLDEPMS